MMNRIRKSGNRRRFAQVLVAGMAVMLGAGSTLIASPASAVDCTSPAPGEPTFIDETCTDVRFNDPQIDLDEMRTTPVPHRYVHGFFAGTGRPDFGGGTPAEFAFAFPPADQYQGRFFQGPTHQLTSNENLGNNQIAFAIASGAYAVQTNMGGSEAATFAEAVLFFGFDAETVGYRVNAAAAKFSRQVAADYYGPHRPYGYLFGGSGGAFQTVSSLENTSVWDGGVPFVLGFEGATPNVYTVRVNAQRILGPAGKFPCILDAVDPGGSGDPVTSCNLNEEQAGAYEEATRMGFPPRSWFGGALTGAGALPLVAAYVPYVDFGYTADFWSLPGYLGHDDPYGSLAPLRIIHNTTVTEKLTGPNRLRLASFPTGDRTAIDLRILSGAGTGANAVGLPPGYVRAPSNNLAALTVTISNFATPIYDAVQVGDEVALDNSHYLSLQTYHRHQVGTPEDGYFGHTQFRNPDGTPIYPQRPVYHGNQYNGSGGHMTGDFHGKMILQESLMDPDAFPMGAEWYKRRVQQVLGKKIDDKFRVYMQDHAQHGGGAEGGTSTRTVAYSGALQHELRTLAAWVEQGVKPPASTNYQMVDDAQVVPAPTAPQRKGIQPVVTLLANDSVRAEVAVGEPVTLTGKIQVPPGAGKVVKVEWNVTGATGAYTPVTFGDVRPAVSVETTTTFAAPGTYFVVLRGTSQREGDPNTPFARVENIARARVVVH